MGQKSRLMLKKRNKTDSYLVDFAVDLFQLQMGLSLPFLRANDLRSSLLNIRARSF